MTVVFLLLLLLELHLLLDLLLLKLLSGRQIEVINNVCDISNSVCVGGLSDLLAHFVCVFSIVKGCFWMTCTSCVPFSFDFGL